MHWWTLLLKGNQLIDSNYLLHNDVFCPTLGKTEYTYFVQFAFYFLVLHWG